MSSVPGWILTSNVSRCTLMSSFPTWILISSVPRWTLMSSVPRWTLMPSIPRGVHREIKQSQILTVSICTGPLAELIFVRIVDAKVIPSLGQTRLDEFFTLNSAQTVCGAHLVCDVCLAANFFTEFQLGEFMGLTLRVRDFQNHKN